MGTKSERVGFFGGSFGYLVLPWKKQALQRHAGDFFQAACQLRARASLPVREHRDVGLADACRLCNFFMGQLCDGKKGA